MGRPKKNVENEDKVVGEENVGQITPAPEDFPPIPTPAAVVIDPQMPREEPKKDKHVSIRDNPYLTDSQKDILIKHELSALLRAKSPNPMQLVTFRWVDTDGRDKCAIATCYLNEVMKAWTFYKENAEKADASEFFSKIGSLATSVKFITNVTTYIDLE